MNTDWRYRLLTSNGIYCLKLIDKLPEAFACFRMVKDDQEKLVGFVLLDMNSHFEKLTGLNKSQLESRLFKGLFPGAENSDFDWVGVFGQLSLRGESSCFEKYNEQNERWYEIVAYSYEPGHFATLIRDITENKKREDKNRYISFHDWLTGLFNRYYLEEEMKRLDTDRQLPISIIFADINGLKLVNDAFGHSFGDKQIKRAALIIKDACREEDIVSRWGGDEYAILLPQTNEEETQIICNRIIESCKNSQVNDLPIFLALGAESKNKPGITLLEIQKKAEEKMYTDKLKSYKETKSVFFRSLYSILREKSFETDTHVRRMRKIALGIGKRLNLSKPELERLAVLILLHDIGKVKIVKNILVKKGALTREEWAVIKEHPETGYRIARATEELILVAEEILCHHEHWDGSGYPRGLKGEEIPLLARIAAIADAYEVMTWDRPYKKAITPEAAADELKKLAGTQFDPQLVELALSPAGK